MSWLYYNKECLRRVNRQTFEIDIETIIVGDTGCMRTIRISFDCMCSKRMGRGMDLNIGNLKS